MKIPPVVDLHTHTFFSDGELCPAELAQRARKNGYRILGITDHADASNLSSCVKKAVLAASSLSGAYPDFTVLAGVELTHVPPSQLSQLIPQARSLGAQVVVVHGETPVEPVEPGTNREAILAGCDILAHPGLISAAEVQLATKMGVYLEISARGGHSLANGHLAQLAAKYGAKLVVNSDAHAPSDILTPDFQRTVALCAGLSEEEYLLTNLHASELAVKLQGQSG
jgi:histidinol phosphatase-like PHP family hydrolase